VTRLSFFDTNILLYADDNYAPAKQTRAISLLTEHRRERSLVVSLQVLQEYFAVATRKMKLDPVIAQEKVEILAGCNVVRFAAHDIIAAIELHRLHQISFWDAMIVHAARIANATVLYTEDLVHGSSIAGIPVRNPFAGM
jgi:predicted nucleic acid-binding protein